MGVQFEQLNFSYQFIVRVSFGERIFGIEVNVERGKEEVEDFCFRFIFVIINYRLINLGFIVFIGKGERFYLMIFQILFIVRVSDFIMNDQYEEQSFSIMVLILRSLVIRLSECFECRNFFFLFFSKYIQN